MKMGRKAMEITFSLIIIGVALGFILHLVYFTITINKVSSSVNYIYEYCLED